MGQEPFTKIEVRMVQTAPLAYELQAAGDAMVKLIKKAPLELQPAALAAALATVAGFQIAADAAVEELPDFPASLSVESISAQESILNETFSHLPDNASAQLFLSALHLLSNVDEMVSPVSNFIPTIPHEISTSFINNQAEKLIEYITREALS